MLKSFDLSVSELKPLMDCALYCLRPCLRIHGTRVDAHSTTYARLESLKQISSALHGKLCLDVSHSFMWCNYTNESFLDYVSSISDLISHVHVSDASRTSQEVFR